MIDAKQLIDQYLGAGTLDKLTTQGRDYGNRAQDTVRQNPLASGAVAGGLAALLMGTKSGRKLGKNALKYGGLAVVAGLAYKAYRDHQAGQRPPMDPSTSGEPQLVPPPADTPFVPDAGHENERALALLIAMIQASKADGYIDPDEQARIFDKLDAVELDAESKAFVLEEMRKPMDLDRVVGLAESPEVAMELYAASLMAIDPDHPAEKGYLDMLAARLGLDPGLVEHLNATVAAARV
jgi:uncharacterized membrane protein YebE (DUF533 family)